MRKPAKFHQITASHKCGERKPFGDGLPERRWNRTQPVETLSASQVPAKTGNHFIENKDSSVFSYQLLQTLEESWSRDDDRFCLENHAGNLPRILVEQLLKARQVVVAELNRQVLRDLRNARGERRAADKPVIHGEKRLVATNGYHIPSRIGARELDSSGGNV